MNFYQTISMNNIFNHIYTIIYQSMIWGLLQHVTDITRQYILKGKSIYRLPHLSFYILTEYKVIQGNQEIV